MDAAPEWIVSTVNDRIVSVSLDYTIFTEIMKKISRMPVESVSGINCRKVSTEDVIAMSPSVRWDDLYLFGTDFQKIRREILIRLLWTWDRLYVFQTASLYADSVHGKMSARRTKPGENWISR